jgi:hypothetical protein
VTCPTIRKAGTKPVVSSSSSHTNFYTMQHINFGLQFGIPV